MDTSYCPNKRTSCNARAEFYKRTLLRSMEEPEDTGEAGIPCQNGLIGANNLISFTK
jgi:hypothetical protein